MTEKTNVTPIKKKHTRAGRRDYKRKFGIAFNVSTNRLMVSVPDSVSFPSTRAWVWLKDTHVLVLSPNRPNSERGAEEVALARTSTLKGCRQFITSPVSDCRGLGSHWRMMDTSYRVVGDRFEIAIPDPDIRLPPIKRGKVPVKTSFTKDEELIEVMKTEGNLVLIERGNEELTFRVPDQELRTVLGDWLFKGFLEKD